MTARVEVRVPADVDVSVPELSRFSIAWAGAATHRLVVCAGDRRLELPESWNVEPEPGMVAALGDRGLEVEVFDA